MNGWRNSNRRSRLPDDWPQRRELVKKRASGRCEQRLPSGARCPRPGIECDHKKPGDDHSLENLQWLCHRHHEVKTIRERPYTGRRRAPKPPKRPEERHPGLRWET